MRGLPSYYYFVYVDKAAKRAHMHETGQRTYGALHIYIYIAESYLACSRPHACIYVDRKQ